MTGAVERVRERAHAARVEASAAQRPLEAQLDAARAVWEDAILEWSDDLSALRDDGAAERARLEAGAAALEALFVERAKLEAAHKQWKKETSAFRAAQASEHVGGRAAVWLAHARSLEARGRLPAARNVLLRATDPLREHAPGATPHRAWVARDLWRALQELLRRHEAEARGWWGGALAPAAAPWRDINQVQLWAGQMQAAAREAEWTAAEQAAAEAARIEAERTAAEQAAAEAARIEAERIAAEQAAAEAARVKAEKIAAEQAAAEAERVEAERIAQEQAPDDLIRGQVSPPVAAEQEAPASLARPQRGVTPSPTAAAPKRAAAISTDSDDECTPLTALRDRVRTGRSGAQRKGRKKAAKRPPPPPPPEYWSLHRSGGGGGGLEQPPAAIAIDGGVIDYTEI